MVEGGTIGDAVEGQAPVEAFPVGHNLVEGIGLAEFLGVAAPVFDFSGADVDGVVMGQDHITAAVSQKAQKLGQILRFHPVVRVNDLQVFAAGRSTSGVQCAAVTLVFLRDQADGIRVCSAVFFRHCGGLVRGTVVDNDDFQPVQNFRHQQGADALVQKRLAVIGGNDDG